MLEGTIRRARQHFAQHALLIEYKSRWSSAGRERPSTQVDQYPHRYQTSTWRAAPQFRPVFPARLVSPVVRPNRSGSTAPCTHPVRVALVARTLGVADVVGCPADKG